MTKIRTVSVEVADVLAKAETNGSALRLVGQLDRKLYEATNKVLEAAGGKWSRKDKAHIFEGDAADAIEPIVLSGEYTLPADFGQFDSPPMVVERVMAHAQIQPGMHVLEPSVGIGNLVLAAEQLGANVMGFEVDAKRHHIATERCWLAGGLRLRDFLLAPPEPVFDRVVMNPPFAKQADIKHVLHAAKFVKPGGRLVSVMSAGARFRNDRRTEEFRDFVERCGGWIEHLPPESFRPAGTSVHTVIVVLDIDGKTVIP